MAPWLPTRSRRPFPQVTEGGEAPAVTPTFEGRAFHRPAEDVEDQGAAFDIATVVTRRNALGVFGAGAGALLLAACGASSAGTSSSSMAASSSSGGASSSSAAGATSSAAQDYTEMSTETAGPYPGDGSNGPDVLEESGIERADLTSSIDGGDAVEGVPLTITLNVIDMAQDDAPMTGAAVYIWHCDAQGRYSMYSDGVTDATWLRGVQVVGDDGTVTFTTIVPGCYAGRWPHVHFEVFPDKDSITDAANAVLTSQIALPQEVCDAVYAESAYSGSAENMAGVSLESDGIFSDGYDQQLIELTGSVSQGYTGTLDVPIDTTTEQQQSSMGGGPGRQGGGPGGQGGTPPQPPTN
ncbi:intradiol ring-cleavage dioxygenase [Micrococcus luteus]